MEIKKGQAFVWMAGLVIFLIIIDGQCYFKDSACLPDFGYFISAPNVVSDQEVLLKGLANGTINSEWKEKPGEVYGIILSNMISGNYHTLSIVSSVALLIVVYALALRITQSRLSSVIAVTIVCFSRTFLWYSDSIPYPGYWNVFFFLSLYPFANKLIRPISFVTSFVMKAQALAFLPVTFLVEKSWKVRFFYIGIGVLATTVSLLLHWERSSGINWGNLAPPYVVFEIILQDFWAIVLFFPVSALLFHYWRKKVEWAGILLGGMLWSLFFQYVLALFTTYGAFSERMLTFIVFFALGSGLVFAQLLKRKALKEAREV